MGKGLPTSFPFYQERGRKMGHLKHEVTEIAPKTWCLSEFRLVNAFLLEGKDKAALIDTGCGIGNLREAVKELTEKPIVILMTHGHFDHLGGIGQFEDNVGYMHSKEEDMLEEMQSRLNCKDLNEMRAFYVKTRAPIRYPEVDVEEILKLIPKETKMCQHHWEKVEDGQMIDLGERQIIVYHTPGHTEGSVCYLDETTRILFSGDTVNHGIILQRQPNNGTGLIEIYHQSIAKIWGKEKYFDYLAVGHDNITIEKQMVRDYLELTEGLLDGTVTGNYEEVGFRKGDVARLRTAELWYQCDE